MGSKIWKCLLKEKACRLYSTVWSLFLKNYWLKMRKWKDLCLKLEDWFKIKALIMLIILTLKQILDILNETQRMCVWGFCP